jgi:hypothetical protein
LFICLLFFYYFFSLSLLPPKSNQIKTNFQSRLQRQTPNLLLGHGPMAIRICSGFLWCRKQKFEILTTFRPTAKPPKISVDENPNPCVSSSSSCNRNGGLSIDEEDFTSPTTISESETDPKSSKIPLSRFLAFNASDSSNDLGIWWGVLMGEDRREKDG